MSLRVERRIPPTRPMNGEEGIEDPGQEGDDWSARIVKLIPAEALGLYGSAVGLIASFAEGEKQAALWLVTAVCALIVVMVRLRATQDKTTGRGPQIKAIGIALISFVIWLAALAATGAQISPFTSIPHIAIAPLAALLWGTVVPYFYQGD
ncbi:MAG: hypothetical protein J7494_06355 [Sphingobium sp.]|nr:hypothetical protein [Sphingobium sp.]